MKKTLLPLRGRIISRFGSQTAFAKAIGLTEQTVTAKLNGRAAFSAKDIISWGNALGISPEEVNQYFFAK